MNIYILSKSERKNKKYVVTTPTNKIIHFGDSRYSDFTTYKHKDINRKKLYDMRHMNNEDWTKNGIASAGFWSKWLLWNEPNIKDSIKAIEKKFNIKIVYV